jgi:hypothetical protein
LGKLLLLSEIQRGWETAIHRAPRRYIYMSYRVMDMINVSGFEAWPAEVNINRNQRIR